MSGKNDKFSYWFDALPAGKNLRAMMKTETEGRLLERLDKSKGKSADILGDTVAR